MLRKIDFNIIIENNSKNNNQAWNICKDAVKILSKSKKTTTKTYFKFSYF